MLELLLGILGLLIIISFILFFIFVFIPWTFGAPFQPTSKKELQKIVKIAEAKKTDKIVDLGSGNGTIVIEFAKRGIKSHGYEINPILVWWSRLRIKKLGLEKLAIVEKRNFWNIDLGKFDIIISFQINYVMKRLYNKIKKEGKNKVKIISNTWKIRNKKPLKKIGHIYLYSKF